MSTVVEFMIANYPDNVAIIPGHGKLTNKTRLKEFAKMIEYSIACVNKALAEGKSEQEILAMGIGNDYKHWSWRFITEQRWLNTLITALK